MKCGKQTLNNPKPAKTMPTESTAYGPDKVCDCTVASASDRKSRGELRQVVADEDHVSAVAGHISARPHVAASPWGRGTDAAGDSAHVVLIGNDLSKLATALSIARRCDRTIRQNFIGTIAVDSVGIVLAGFGLLTPLLAAFIHVASEMTFILNSARLVPTRRISKSQNRGS